MSQMDIARARRLAEDIEATPKMQMARKRDHMILMRAQSAIDRSKHMVAKEIKREQKIAHKRFQLMLQQSKLRHARMIGDRQLEKKLRLEKEGILNTDLAHDDKEDILRHIWNYGKLQMAWTNENTVAHPGTDSRCISAVQSENRNVDFVFPPEKSVVFKSPDYSKRNHKKERPISTVSIVQPERKPVRPATAYELGAIRKALLLDGSEVDVIATRGPNPTVYITDAEDTTENDLVPRHNAKNRREAVKSDLDASGKVNFNSKKDYQETPSAEMKVCDSGKAVKFSRKCNSWIESDTDANNCDGYLRFKSEPQIDNDIHSRTVNNIGDQVEITDPNDEQRVKTVNFGHGEKRQSKHVQIRDNNYVGFKRPETAPHVLMTQDNKEQSADDQKYKSALSRQSGRSHSTLSRSRSRKKITLFKKEDKPTPLDFHRQDVEIADYPGRVKEFTDKIIPLKAGEHHVTDYYVSRMMEEQSRDKINRSCALRFTSRSPEIEGAKLDKVCKIPNLTFKSVNYTDYSKRALSSVTESVF